MILKQLADGMVVMLGNAVLAALGAGLAAGAAWLASKFKSERAQSLLSHVDDLAMTVIRSVYQAYVKPLKEAGSWNEQAHADAHKMALQELKSYLGSKGIDELQKVISGDLGSFLSAAINEAVHNNKLMGQAALPLQVPAQG